MRGSASSQGAESNDKKVRCWRDEPGDHALGRSRGGLSTKTHVAVDGRGRPLAYSSRPIRARNVIERAFNLIKNWRALATRYDKHALIYRGGLILAAALMWLRH